jgi:hypothetical protein
MEKLNSIRIETAIEQHFSGTGGIYTQMNILSRRKMGLREWRKLCHSDAHRTPEMDTDPDSMASEKRASRTPHLKKRRRLDHKKKSKSSLTATENEDPLIPLQPFPSSPEYYKELERAYWKNTGFGAPLYGADMYRSNF